MKKISCLIMFLVVGIHASSAFAELRMPHPQSKHGDSRGIMICVNPIDENEQEMHRDADRITDRDSQHKIKRILLRRRSDAPTGKELCVIFNKPIIEIDGDYLKSHHIG